MERHLSEHEVASVGKVVGYIENFCQQHPCTVGGLEIAAGTALIAVGIKTGHIGMGNELFGVDVGSFNVEALPGSAVGAGLVLTCIVKTPVPLQRTPAIRVQVSGKILPARAEYLLERCAELC